MPKYAKVLVEKDALSSVQESIGIGKQVLQRKLAAYRTKVAKFEELNNMDTVTFSNLFNKGELGDKKEWLKWDHYASAVNLLKKNYLILNASDMNLDLRLQDILIACKIADWYSTDMKIDYDLDLSLGILFADGKIVFYNGSILEFTESITPDRLKYRYH